jgi:hypothetical protein
MIHMQQPGWACKQSWGDSLVRGRRRTQTVRGLGVKTEVVREVDAVPNPIRIEGLVEITSWLGTFGERQRLARSADLPAMAAQLDPENERLNERRAELVSVSLAG